MKELLTISEFSKLSGVETTTLRYWDDIGLFKPARRDDENGYRYYIPNQIITINFISVLSGLDISLKTINQFAENRTPESAISLIEQQEKHLSAEIRTLSERFAVMHTRRELIRLGLQMENAGEVSVMSFDGLRFVRGRRNSFKPGEKFYQPFMKFCGEAESMRINLQLPIGAIHDDFQGFLEAPGSPDYWMSVDPSGNEEIQGGKYLMGTTRGYYGEFGDLPEHMEQFIKKNNITISGPSFEIYLHDEVCIKSPTDYLTLVCVAIAE